MARYGTPDAMFADLFAAVQTSGIFEDSKTFVDAVPKSEPGLIVQSFREERHAADFDLRAFVAANFDMPRRVPQPDAVELVPDGNRPVREHIELLWDVLTRAPDEPRPGSSLIALPRSYIVPGGRFREIYYWDSYFTMLGLAASGRIDAIQDMVDNFAFLIDRLGFVPNGNRSYYGTRSQPPLFALMVELLAEVKQDQGILAGYVDALEREYEFWMAGCEDIGPGEKSGLVARRVVAAHGGLVNGFVSGFVNRYRDDSDGPRPESYAEDVALARTCQRDAAHVYRDVRSACESGWDFSSRWLADGRSLTSIRTSDVVPVDLNAILYQLECTLARALEFAGRGARARFLDDRANGRLRLMQSRFFDEERGFFVDLLLPDLRPTGVLSLAGAYPLFFGIATPEQASRVARTIHTEFLKAGGWVTTLTETGQQWDAPNGWAPLQWVVHGGLKRYGFVQEARAGARRWVDNNLAVYRATGRLLEKYNVEDVGLLAGGGEYAVQDGFGWTNGVLLSFLNELAHDG